MLTTMMKQYYITKYISRRQLQLQLQLLQQQQSRYDSSSASSMIRMLTTSNVITIQNNENSNNNNNNNTCCLNKISCSSSNNNRYYYTDSRTIRKSSSSYDLSPSSSSYTQNYSNKYNIMMNHHYTPIITSTTTTTTTTTTTSLFTNLTQQIQIQCKRYMVTIPRNPDIYDDLYPNPDANNDPFPPPMRTNTTTRKGIDNNNENDEYNDDNSNRMESSNKSRKRTKTSKKKKSEKQVIAEELENEYKDIYNQKTRIYLKLCYTDHDIEEGDIIKSYFHYDDILETAEEEFGVEIDSNPKKNYKLEYYNGEDWIKLVPYRLYEVLQFFPCTSIKPLPIRVPALYDEEYGTRNDVVKLKKVTPDMRKKQLEYIKSGPSPQQWLMKEMIDGIVRKLKMDGYTRSSNSTLQQPILQFYFHDTIDGTLKSMEQNTKEYVLDLARSCPWTIPTLQEEAEMERQQYKEQGIERPGSKANPLGINPEMMNLIRNKDQKKKKPTSPGAEGGEGTEGDSTNKTAIESENDPNKIIKKLKHVLLSQPRALQHIVECIHYDYVWEN